MGITYEQWIARERKIRSALLMDSDQIRNSGICRTCHDCDEICLCHETVCPNCGGTQVADRKVRNLEREVRSRHRIRCRLRFEKIRQSEIPKEL
jgi:hypothetical protein